MSDKLKILILEDNPADSELVLRKINRTEIKFESKIVDNKVDFEKALDEFSPDIVLADFKLGNYDGLTALEFVKKYHPTTQFIIVSGSMGEEIGVECMKKGADDYILKDRLARLPSAIESAITKKQIKEKIALAESKLKFYHTLVQNVSDAIISTDNDFKILSWNPAAISIFGYTESEALGKNIFDLLKTEFIDQNIDTLYRSLVEKGIWRGELIERKKSGAKVFIFSSASVIKDEMGNMIGIVSVNTDITEKKRAEEELKNSKEQLRALAAYLQSVREEESSKIAREIHDELGQVLTAIKLDIYSLLDKPQNDLTLKKEKLNRVLEMINSAITTVRKIASELRPGLLDQAGLIPALEWQIQEYQKRSDIEFICSFPEKVNYKRELSTAIFRVFQELLTNCIRHSKATKINITLKDEENVVKLIVKDNGIGMDDSKIGKTTSTGLLGISERIKLLGGEFFIKGIPNLGTVAVVIVPTK